MLAVYLIQLAFWWWIYPAGTVEFRTLAIALAVATVAGDILFWWSYRKRHKPRE